MERTPIEKGLYENRTRTRSRRKLQHQNRAEPKARPTRYGRAAAQADPRAARQGGREQNTTAAAPTWTEPDDGRKEPGNG